MITYPAAVLEAPRKIELREQRFTKRLATTYIGTCLPWDCIRRRHRKPVRISRSGLLLRLCSTPEVYTAIQQGQIDGNATGPQLLWALKNHEVAKYLSFTNHGRAAAVVIMNLKKWNAMTPEQKATLDEGAKAFFWTDSAYFTSNPNTANDRVVGFMAQSGVVVTEPDIQAFRKSTLPVVQAFKARVKSPLVDQALKDAGYE